MSSGYNLCAGGCRGIPALALCIAVTTMSHAGDEQRVRFRDVSVESGIADVQHFSYRFGGDGYAGLAWFDYNNDGRVDLYLANGKSIRPASAPGFDNALLENQGDGTFLDVAALRGVAHGLGSAGVIAGDIDNDGDQDVLLTGDGGFLGNDGVTGQQTVDSGVALYLNQGPPRYDYLRLPNEQVGLAGIDTGLSAAFADVDNDGLLDLFIGTTGTIPAGCQPPPPCDADDPSTRALGSHLLLNRSQSGEILFVDVSDVSGISVSRAGAFAVMFSDYNDDGLMDLYVANGVANIGVPARVELYENRGYDEDLGSPRFIEVGQSIGLEREDPWMGLAAADFDDDGLLEIFVTNTGGRLRPHALLHWLPSRNGFFDVARLTGIAARRPGPSDYFGWGCTAQDFDNDGRPDLFFAGSNGPTRNVGTANANPGTLLINDPPLTFVDHSDSLGIDLSARFTSGVAGADFDGDGRIDLAVATDNYLGDLGLPVLLRNVTDNDHRWLTIRLRGNGIDTNRDAYGAKVIVRATGGRTLSFMREVHGGSSFASMDASWLTMGLGALDGNPALNVLVDWPDGPQGRGDPDNWISYGPFHADTVIDIEQ